MITPSNLDRATEGLMRLGFSRLDATLAEGDAVFARHAEENGVLHTCILCKMPHSNLDACPGCGTPNDADPPTFRGLTMSEAEAIDALGPLPDGRDRCGSQFEADIPEYDPDLDEPTRNVRAADWLRDSLTAAEGGDPKQLPTAAEPEPLADVIRRISDGFDRLKKSGLNRKAIVVLLHDASGVGKRDIERVLDSLADLAKQYTVAKFGGAS